jgi:OOP family OmpA-OmpF porin
MLLASPLPDFGALCVRAGYGEVRDFPLDSKEMIMTNVLARRYLILLAALSLAPFSTSIAQEGFYVGGDIGYATIDDSGVDDEDISFHFMAGWQFNENFGVEFGYADFGEFDAGIVDIEADGFDVSFVGAWPVADKFSLTGRLGYLWWDLDAGAFGDDDGSDLLFGIGGRYDLNDQFMFYGGWTRYEISDADLDNFHIGGAFRFK